MRLTDKELRIRRYTAKLAMGKRLFEPGEYVPPGRNSRARCIGCDSLCDGYGRSGPPQGWESRTVHRGGLPLCEVHCPSCLREWGHGEMCEEAATEGVPPIVAGPVRFFNESHR